MNPARCQQLHRLMRRARREGWAEWVRGPADHAAMLDGCWFDLKSAQFVREFLSRFVRHTIGRWAGQPFDLLEWEWHDVIGPIFGWKRADGLRRFRTAFVFTAKKNGKTTLAAAIALLMLVADREEAAEIYAANTSRDQAASIYREVERIIAKSPALTRLLKCHRSVKTVSFQATNSFFKTLPRDQESTEGLNIHAVIVDELHAQRNRALFDALRYGGATRDQPLTFIITTAGDDHASICFELYEYACKVRDGAIRDSTFLPVIYEAPQDADIRSPKTWRMANPSLGVTIREDDFAADAAMAVSSPASERAFRRYRLNQWVGAERAWLSMENWNHPANRSPVTALAAREMLRGRPCHAGLDMATTTDIAALVLAFDLTPAFQLVPADQSFHLPWTPEPGTVALLPFLWLPEDGLAARELRDRVPYAAWSRAGLVELTPGNVIDYDRVRERIVQLSDIYNILSIGADPHNATQLLTQLQSDGLQVLAFRQGFISMNAPSKEFERLILSRRLVHFDHEPLRWQASNVIREDDAAGNIKPSKKKSRQKIDAIVAAIMAIGRLAAPDTQPAWDGQLIVIDKPAADPAAVP